MHFFCFDYREWKTMKIRDGCTFPCMEEGIYSIWKGYILLYFTCQIGLMANRDGAKLQKQNCFCNTNWFVQVHILMLFGLKNSPGAFQLARNAFSVAEKWQYVLAYISDVIVFSTSPEDHVKHVATVLSMIKNSRVVLKERKRYLRSDAVGYIEHVITPGKFQVAIKT